MYGVVAFVSTLHSGAVYCKQIRKSERETPTASSGCPRTAPDPALTNMAIARF